MSTVSVINNSIEDASVNEIIKREIGDNINKISTNKILYKETVNALDIKEGEIIYMSYDFISLNSIQPNYENIYNHLSNIPFVKVVYTSDSMTEFMYANVIVIKKDSILYVLNLNQRFMMYNPSTLNNVTMSFDDDANMSLYSNTKKDDIYECIGLIQIYYSNPSASLPDILKLLGDNIFIHHKYGNKNSSANKPKYNLLSGNPHDGFYLNKISTDKLDVDLDTNYDDYVSEFYDKANEFIRKDKASGLLLMTGLPGTGKTSLINKMMQDNPDINFIYINDSILTHLESPEFVHYLSTISNSVLILEDQENLLKSRDNHTNPIISTLLNITSGLLSSSINCRIIITYNYGNKDLDVDNALKRKGRLVASVNIGKLSLDKTKKLASKLGLNPDEFNDDSLLSDIYNYGDVNEFGDKSNRSQISFMKDRE